jgi:hypothetical protein
MEYLFEKIKQIPYHQYDSQTMFLIRGYTIAAINSNTNVSCANTSSRDTFKNKKRKWYGLETFWNLIQDQTEAAPDVSFQAQSSLIDFLAWPLCHLQRYQFYRHNNSVRHTYMELCVDNLRDCKSVPQSLRLLCRIIGIITIAEIVSLLSPRNLPRKTAKGPGQCVLSD